MAPKGHYYYWAFKSQIFGWNSGIFLKISFLNKNRPFQTKFRFWTKIDRFCGNFIYEKNLPFLLEFQFERKSVIFVEIRIFENFTWEDVDPIVAAFVVIFQIEVTDELEFKCVWCGHVELPQAWNFVSVHVGINFDWTRFFGEGLFAPVFVDTVFVIWIFHAHWKVEEESITFWSISNLDTTVLTAFTAFFMVFNLPRNPTLQWQTNFKLIFSRFQPISFKSSRF